MLIVKKIYCINLLEDIEIENFFIYLKIFKHINN